MPVDTVHDNRKDIFDYISNNPGSHLRKIARDLDMRLSTLRYHLVHLEKNGSIVSQKQNNLKIYFISGKLNSEEKALTQLLQQKRFRDIILVLIDSPGSTFTQIAEKLSMSHSTASKYINILEDRKILIHEKAGRKKRYRINDEQSVIELLKTYKKLMANMSFEIRNPMNAIVGMASLLLEEDMTEEQKGFVETIRISAEALMAIVNDILDSSKIEQEKAGLKIRTFNLRDCVEEALQSVAEKAAAKKLDLAYAIDKISPDIIIGDPKRLSQILINLLNNAVKFTNEGEVIVLISSLRLESLYEIHFAVKDTGIGISPDNLDRLFNSCSNQKGPYAKEGKYSDTSLCISRELVELMNGRIWAESSLGEGSIFHFTIKTKHVPHISTSSGIQLPLEGMRMLIVEENKAIGNILETQAVEWGMIPITSTDGKEIPKLISGPESFDIALLDISMHEDSGFSMVEEIRKIDKALPVIALTFAGQRIQPGLCKNVLVKPVRQLDLFNALKAALDEKFRVDHEETSAKGSPQADLRILIAEDNESNQKVILSMFKRLGYQAHVVSNGKEVLQALESANYDLLLMDVKMPEMDGLEATRIIRRRLHNEIKIIAITAYALKGDREKCLEAGMDDYISKPVSMEELKRMLKWHQFI